MGKNDTLRTLREYLNLSMQEVAEGAKVSFRTVLRAEKGDPLNPESRKRLCKFYGKTSEELGLVPQHRRAQCDASHQCSSAVVKNRRGQITDISASIIENLAQITQQYRSLHCAGLAIEDGLKSHIGLIQNALENTVNERHRCELWRIQAQSQLLVRQAAMRKHEFALARTWNEYAIASAQYSGDAFLLGAALGHLAHLYLTWQHDPVATLQLLDQAQGYTRGHPVNGWLAMVDAAMAAKESNRGECENWIARATQVAQEMPHTAEYTDLYYTDFNVAGTDAFAGDCLLKVGEPTKALERLTSINLDALAENRHASAFYDMAYAYAVLSELEAMQVYAFRSIDKALTTNRLYIIPRFVTLAQKIQETDQHESHAVAIVEYAHVALQNSKD